MSYGEPVENKGSSTWDLSEFKGLNDVDLLARMIYSESRGEIYKGQLAVAMVARNRVRRQYMGKKTYTDVLLQSNQFEGMTTTSARKPDTSSSAWKTALDIAKNREALSKDNPIGDRMFFTPYCPSNAKNAIKIGNHYFYDL